jgi:bacillithiol biosynthesis cysteine-adding enzyme BshC
MNKMRLDQELLGHLPDLAIHVLKSDPALEGFYRPFSEYPSTSFLEEKKQHFTTEKRETLLRVMREQYDGFDNPPIGINELTDENCFTITTGHQLNLFTGPLFSWYKIIDIIKIAQSWNQNKDSFRFVPVFWMASEDHDLAEINHFYSKGQQVHWSSDKKGAVGRMPTQGLDKVLQAWSTHLGKSAEADQLKKWFKEAYLGHESLADATRYLLHQLFGKHGLIVLDADHPELKQMFIPVMMEELKSQTVFKNTKKTHTALQKVLHKSFAPQVTPRPINLFYLQTDSRQRIDLKNDDYFLIDSGQKFTKEEILRSVRNQPQCFSPNALMRPLYQETILPNVAYVGGGSELAYWLQLKDSFATFGLMMPMLKLRSSLLLKSQKQDKKLHLLGLKDQNLFLDPNALINLRVRQISNIDIDLSYLKKQLEEQFKNLYDLTHQTDASFLGAVAAQEKKQKKGIDRLEQRLLKAQRRKLVDQIQRVTDLQRELFPMGQLQERFCNFSDFYLVYGDALLPMLMESLDPFDKSFLSLTI